MNAIEQRFTYYRTVTDDETAAAVLVLAETVRGKRLEVTVKSESGEKTQAIKNQADPPRPALALAMTKNDTAGRGVCANKKASPVDSPFVSPLRTLTA